MKKIFLAFFVCIGLPIMLLAQTDKVFLHNGNTMEVSVKSISSGLITYSYPNEVMTQEISAQQVEKIVFSSGRTQQISEKIIINGKDDWEKVIITTSEADIIGLVRKGDVKGTWTGSSLSGTAKVQEKAEREAKQNAAKLGAHVIFVQTYDTRQAGGMDAVTGFGQNAKAAVRGVAYGYE